MKFFKNTTAYIGNSKKHILKKILICLLPLLVISVAIVADVFNRAETITPEERINTDSVIFVNEIEQYFRKNNQLPVDLEKIPRYDYIAQKYSVKLSKLMENNHVIIELYWPSHMLKSIISIKINSDKFIYKCTIIHLI